MLARVFAKSRLAPAPAGVHVAGLGLVVLMLVLAGCVPVPTAVSPAAPAAAPTTAPAPTAMPAATMAPTAMPAATMPPTAMAAATTAPAATSAVTVTATGPAMLAVATDAKLGKFLADDKGMTLYLYTKDTKNTSNCYDKCAAAWPPLYTVGAAKPGDGVDASLIGTTTRTDGKMQVTYAGWPLYYWVKDTKPGDTTGQNVGGVWFVISPKGEMIQTGAGAATPAAGTTPAATAVAAGGGQTVTVNIKDFAFGAPITVAPGTTVEWVNQDSAPHTVTADDGSYDSGNMNQGAKFTHTYTAEGTFPYYCVYHGGKGGTGMAGTVIVKK